MKTVLIVGIVLLVVLLIEMALVSFLLGTVGNGIDKAIQKVFGKHGDGDDRMFSGLFVGILVSLLFPGVGVLVCLYLIFEQDKDNHDNNA